MGIFFGYYLVETQRVEVDGELVLVFTGRVVLCDGSLGVENAD
jgi:hypothetical protein